MNIPIVDILEAEHHARMRYCGHWWCETCKIYIHPKDVTYNKEHDVKSNGCGNRVYCWKVVGKKLIKQS